SAALISSASSSSARCSPGWIAASAISMLLVVVNNFHVRWAPRTINPFEANPPLIVNADAVLPLPVTYQCFETIPGQCNQVPQRSRRLHTVQFHARGPFKSRECLNPLPSCEISGPVVPIAEDHYCFTLSELTRYVKRTGRLVLIPNA